MPRQATDTMSEAPDSDDERTRPRPASSGGSGLQPGLELGHTLPVGTLIRDYEISALIGEGGFGIVYLAYDHSLQRAVAIKEYMPSSMASRVNGSTAVRVKSERHEETFRAGLKSFVNEARLLARFDHPALVKVYRFWEENGTAYMAMPYYEGPTLKSALATRAEPPDETQLRDWLRPLIDALAVMHAAHCFHRDIAPDNILLTPTGPLLLDFGAARRVIGDMTHALTVVLKPGYAPIEQYGDIATMAQGAWTDLYALACVVYFAVTGKVPTSSVERLMDDRLEPLSRVAAGRYSPRFLSAIDAALAVRPHDRPQTEAQFRALLDGPPSNAPADTGLADATTPAVARPASLPSVGTDPFQATQVQSLPWSLEPVAKAPAAADTAKRRRPSMLVVAVALAGLLLIAFAVQWLRHRSASEAERSAAPTSERSAVPASPVQTPPAHADGVPAIVPAPDTTAAARTTPAPDATLPAPPLGVSVVPATPESTARPTASPPAAAEAPPPDREPPTLRPTHARTLPSEREAPRERPARLNPPAGLAQAKPPRDDAEASPPPKEKPARNAGSQARCSDILQKASLEALTSDEAAYLKRECR